MFVYETQYVRKRYSGIDNQPIDQKQKSHQPLPTLSLSSVALPSECVAAL